MAERRPLVVVGGQVQQLPAADTLPGGGGGGAAAIITAEIDLGTPARRSGNFAIPGVDMTIGQPVLVQKAVGPYTGKGTRADEAEMDLVTATGVVESATVIRVYWQSKGPVRGNMKFNYVIGG